MKSWQDRFRKFLKEQNNQSKEEKDSNAKAGT